MQKRSARNSNDLDCLLSMAESSAYLVQELLRRAVLGDGALGGGRNGNEEVVRGVEVVLVPQHGAGKLLLFARVPLGRDINAEAIARVGFEPALYLRSTEHVGCHTNKKHRRINHRTNSTQEQ